MDSFNKFNIFQMISGKVRKRFSLKFEEIQQNFEENFKLTSEFFRKIWETFENICFDFENFVLKKFKYFGFIFDFFSIFHIKLRFVFNF